MRIVFIGTSEFAAPILKSIKEKTDWEVVLVVSEPAKPAGKKKMFIPSPVALAAQELNLSLVTPESIKNAAAQITDLAADIMIIAAYGQILPAEIISIPKFKTVNVHPSLLPRLRGASPIQAALAKGLTETGVSLMLIDEKVDHGPVISQVAMAIKGEDTYLTLEPKLAELGAKIIIRDLPRYVSGELQPRPQDDSQATFTKLIKKETGQINWQKMSAEEVYNLWRAYLKWPGIYTFFKDRTGRSVRLKLIEIQKCAISDIAHKAGEVFIDASKNLYITCREGTVKITKLQPESSKILTIQEFLNGYVYLVGRTLY
ncbi:MAG: methionyl-tRNA formyltransferase [Candidatus Sungbacteria bacterium]|uniref:Methionyl-tRNA formyltransferase n=1 Tax=Candidatus Sungiibacteriota bacterium TaxID=2750080 RepID=A0A9D6DNS8_9BACT|nr:methionyl-tRNA formyltransferase [Candidatus Sungbacteria bacterium]